MPYRLQEFAEGEYYHLLGRGAGKQNIFADTRDYARFLFYILYFQSPLPLYNIGRHVTSFIKEGQFGVEPKMKTRIVQERYTELVCFALMPNHFHLLVKEKTEGGISRMMQRVLDGYTKYFNIRYKRSGHLFQGPFHAVHVGNNTQLLHLSAYLHRNPRELSRWKQQEEYYQWSSYQDYTRNNRWSNLLVSEVVLGQFKNNREYLHFVKTSTAKKLREELLLD